jgi:hypothetical protein
MGASHGAYLGVRRFMRSCRPFMVLRRMRGQAVLRVVGISVALIFVIGILCAMTLR